MTLDDIKVFLAIAQTGNLTAAAQNLYVSQPALSKRLARFEADLGAALFERGQGARKLTLTPAGKLLLPFAERWESLQQEFNMLHDINSRVHFFIEATNTIGEFALPDAIYDLHQAEPDIELVVSHNESRACYSSVHDHLCDLAFVTQQHFFQNIMTTPLWQEEMLLLSLPREEDAELVNTSVLCWEDEVVIPWNTDFMHWRQEQLAFSQHPTVSVSNMHQATPYLLKQNAWIIAPATVAHAALHYCPELRAYVLSDPPPSRTVYWLEEYGRHHAFADTLLKLMQKHMRAIPGVRWL